MEKDFINLTEENLEKEHLCCIIRSRVLHPGVEAKRKWLAENISRGHVFRKLNKKATAFIEYAPLENAWVPIEGDNFLYIYCLWVTGEEKNHGYGKELLEYCIKDAKRKGMSGVCFLGAKKQKGWLQNQSFACKYGFQAVDETPSGYLLFALAFDGTAPRFSNAARSEAIDSEELTIFYDHQCPFIYQKIEKIREYCMEKHVPLSLNYVDTLKKAKELPCPFNNWAVFYRGKFVTVNVLDIEQIGRLVENGID